MYNTIRGKGKGKAITLQAWKDLEDSRRFRITKFQENRHIEVVRLLALRIGRHLPREIFMAFIYVRG